MNVIDSIRSDNFLRYVIPTTNMNTAPRQNDSSPLCCAICLQSCSIEVARHLLFQGALSVTSENRGLSAHFLCHEAFDKRPLAVHGMPKAQSLSSIKLIYLPNVVRLQQHINHMHQLKELPCVLIIEDLSRYIKDQLDKEKIALCFKLQDLAAFMQETLNESFVGIWISMSSDDINLLRNYRIVYASESSNTIIVHALNDLTIQFSKSEQLIVENIKYKE